MIHEPTRREFLALAGGGLGAMAAGPLACAPGWSPPPDDGWDAGELLHLLPSVSHERILLKASFRSPVSPPPELEIAEQRHSGRATDSEDRFFSFDVAGLQPGTRYRLRLRRPSGEPLCDAWPLATFPAPEAEPKHFRLLVYTCAGGDENLTSLGPFHFEAFLGTAARQRLFARALSFEPDAVVANGDHVYWDLRSKSARYMGASWLSRTRAGTFSRAHRLLGNENEGVLKKAFGPQIADLYGVRFRSTPTFFLQDDHDYGENDEADDVLRTFPADAFMLDLARTTQRLYYPELIADPAQPRATVRQDRLAESFGSLRYGRLFEALLYDCRRELRNALDPMSPGEGSGFLSAGVEAWLADRSLRSPAAHVVHMPSTPVLWTAGKWGEWYPDFQDAEGRIGRDARKPWWPKGWNQQHDRLIASASSRRDRTAFFVSGDLHAIASGRIVESNGRSLADNPVHSLLVGPIGTAGPGFPSRFRGQLPVPSETLRSESDIEPLEENGFTLLDVTPGRIRASFFRWLPERGEAAIDDLQPFEVLDFPRPARSA